MIENRFFTWVWRFNALAIALTVTFVLGLIAWEMTRDMRRAVFPTHATEMLNVTPPGEPAGTGETPNPVDEIRRFGPPADRAASGIYALPLYVDQTYRNRGISKDSGGNRVNFLVVDTDSQSQDWLFEGTQQLITDVQPLWRAQPNQPRVFLGHVLHVIHEDTNRDGRLSRKDAGTLYFLAPQWSAPVVLAEGMTTLLKTSATQPAEFDVIYTSPDVTRLRRFAVPQGNITLDIDLSDTP